MILPLKQIVPCIIAIRALTFQKKIHKVSANHDCRIEEYAVDSRQILKDQFLWVFFRQ